MAQAPTAKVTVSIQFCGGWGYGPKFRAARDLLVQKYGDKIDVVSIQDANVTGNFEIKVNGVLVHSKKTKGHAFLHDNKDQQVVVYKAIDDALKG